jgi:Putative zinc-finger/Predicted integral membrane protein (DUF2275)
MKDCKEVGERLPALLEGDISESEARELRGHLDSCDPCRRAYQNLEKSKKLLGNLTEVEPPPWFTQKIMARIEEESARKKGWLQKLFYPLHIKVPIEAVASLLIAFLAWQVYMATEPERAAFKAPPGSMPVITENYSLQGTDKTPPAKPETEKKQDTSKASPKKDLEPEALTGASRPSEKEPEGRMVAAQRAPEPVVVGEKKGMPEDRREEKSFAAVPSRKLESPPLASAPLPAPAASSLEKDGKMADALEPAPKKEKTDQDRVAVKARALPKSRPVGILLQVTDPQKAGQEAMDAFRQAESRNLQRESQEEREIISALVASQKLPGLLETLKKMGAITESFTAPPEQHDLVPVRIEIIRKK